MHLSFKFSAGHRALKVLKRRFEDAVVVVVNGDGQLWRHHAQCPDPLRRVHGKQYAEHADTAQMHQSDVNIRVPVRNFTQEIVGQGIAGDVEALKQAAVGFEVEDTAHDLRQEAADELGAVPAG